VALLLLQGDSALAPLTTAGGVDIALVVVDHRVCKSVVSPNL
jgi:hypothetical protein